MSAQRLLVSFTLFQQKMRKKKKKNTMVIAYVEKEVMFDGM